MRQHQSLEERFEAATLLQEHEIPTPILVDKMDNNASVRYASVPERLFIIHNGKLAYVGDLGPGGYHPEEIEMWLKDYKKTL